MRRLFTIAGLLVIPLAVRATSPAAPQAAQTSPAAPAASQAYTFPTGAGLLFFYVRPDRTAEFDGVVARLNEVLEAAQDPVGKPQASGWRIFKSIETMRDSAIYVFFFDPAIAGADYDPVKLLGAALPAEAHALYEKLKSSIVRVERMGLQKIR